MNDIHQPHDKFFKQIIANRENAKSFIEFALPKEISDYIDYNTIESINTEKILKRYKRLNLDAAFRFKAKNKTAQVYFLIEHKSETESFSIIQILSYMLAVWEDNYNNKESLEPIVPIVFYHGISQWNKPINFLDNFEAKNMFRKYLPAFEYILIDTNTTEEETFSLNIENQYLLAALLAFKNAFKKNIEIYSKILSHIKDTTLDDFLVYFTYIVTVGDLDEKEMQSVLEATVGGDKMAPVIDKWIQKGREEGLIEGMEKGVEKGRIDGMITEAQELLLDAIEAKFGGVPKDLKLVIQNTKDREKLRNILKATFKIQSLDEIRGMF